MATVNFRNLTIGGEGVDTAPLVQQFRETSRRDLTAIQTQLGINENQLNQLLAESQEDLYSITEGLSNTQKALRADIELYNLNLSSDIQKNNLAIASLTDNFDEETKRIEQEFAKNLADLNFDHERQGIEFRHKIASLEEGQKKTDILTKSQLDQIKLAREKAEEGDKANEQLFRQEQADLRAQLGYLGDVGRSLDRTQNLFDQRLSLIDEVRDLQIAQNVNVQQAQKRALRGSVFQGQALIARQGAINEVFGANQGAFFGQETQFLQEEQVGRRISALTAKLKNTQIQKELIAKQALDRTTGVKLQKEGVNRQILSVKNSERKAKSALKKNNIVREKQKKDLKYALKGLDIKQKQVEDLHTLSGVSTKRQISKAHEQRNLANRQYAVNKSYLESMNVLDTVYGKKAFDLKMAKQLNNFSQTIRQRRIEHREKIREAKRKAFLERRKRSIIYEQQKALVKRMEEAKKAKEDAEETLENVGEASQAPGQPINFGDREQASRQALDNWYASQQGGKLHAPGTLAPLPETKLPVPPPQTRLAG